MRYLAMLTVCLACVSFGQNLRAIEVAESLFVDLDATTLSVGDLMWQNRVDTYADFMADGNPIVTLDPTPAVYFDGTSAFFSDVSAPEDLTGFDPTRSIEVWAFNPSISGEETMVAWGNRGGPQGTNLAFNYGDNGAFGAVGHWGAPDMGWIDNDGTAGAPEAGQWHHLVYTYDAEFARVYADGELMNEEDMIQHGGLDTWPDAGIAIGAQWADATTLNGGLRASMFISRVRVHDGVLTDSQIEANYREELAAFTVAPEIPPPPPKPQLAGLWRFDDANNLGFDSGLEGNHLDENGGVSFDGDGVIGGALALDGFDGMLTSTEINEDLPVGNSPYTVAAWIRPEEVEARGIVGWGSYGSGRSVNALRIFGDNGFRHYWWGADLDAQDFDVDALGVDLDDGDWHHVAAVYDGEERSLYMNGELLVSDLPGDNGAVAANFAVGRTCDFCGAGEFFSGWLDDVAVFNIALDEGQLQEIMSGDFSAFLTGGLAGDFNQNQQLDVADVDLLIAEMIAGTDAATFDLDHDNQVDDADLTVWVKDLANTYFGDANLDGEFNSSDLVAVFQDGKFEADVDPAATWAQGDWNGDGHFTSGDFVKAFQDGGFELGPRNVAAVPEPTLSLFAILLSLVAIRRRVRRS